MKEVIVRYADNGYGNATGEIVGELVRCGECEKGEEAMTGKIRCKSSFDGLCMEKEDFCSYGERKE